MTIWRLGAVALATLPCETSFAATDDFQNWTTLSLQGKITHGLLGAVEVVGRATDNASRLGQIETRFQLGHPLSKAVTIWIGYVRVVTYEQAGRDGIENLSLQQLDWAMGRVLGGTLSSRTRFEQRFQRGVSKTAFRLRQQLRLSVPLRKGGPHAVVWIEPFVSLNNTSAIESGLDQVRSFAGANVPLFEGGNVEAGYLNQYQKRASGNRNNHALSVTLGYRF